MNTTQLLVSASIPSILVVLSWLHNNTRLSRLEAGQDAASRRFEAGQDATNRRLDEMVRGFHSDMMSFKASVLESVYQLRERVTALETKQNS